MSQPNEGQDRLDYRETEDITEVHAARALSGWLTRDPRRGCGAAGDRAAARGGEPTASWS